MIFILDRDGSIS